MYHLPVMLNECIENLNIKPDGIYVDVTFGGGGHSRAILSRLGSEGRLYAFDQDADALANALEDSRFKLIHENFRYMKNEYANFKPFAERVKEKKEIFFKEFDEFYFKNFENKKKNTIPKKNYYL